MTRIKGKEQLCSSEKKYFKSIQGFGDRTLFDRYPDIESVVKKQVNEKYRHFLAEPDDEGDTITWYSVPYNETPVRFSELQGEERITYEKVKNETLSHYQKVIGDLKNENQSSEAEALESAIKFINDDFLYCYDGILVLGIWGMQLKENYRESLGTVSKNLFKIKKKIPVVPPVVDPTPEIAPEVIAETPEPNESLNNIQFNAGDHGTIQGTSEFQKALGQSISQNEIPRIEPKEGYQFTGWDQNPTNFQANGDTVFTAQYAPIIPPIVELPWYMRLWNWIRNFFFGRGCLRWLLWLLLFLLLLFLLLWLLQCCESKPEPIPDPIEDKPWVLEDSLVSDEGGIYDPGNPYEKVPTPPEYEDILPPYEGELPPVDSTEIIREPGQPVILGNRLNILMENEDKSIMDFARAFKVKYPDENYKVVYYDDVVKRMQIEIPSEERLNLKTEIPQKFAPEYKLFVFDESLFESGHIPNDPAFSSEDKAWYLKAINAPKAWDITKGSPNLTIAIVDNGFSLDHPELNSKVVMPYNVWDRSSKIFAHEVDHGTHVAGTALALMDNQEGLTGIAPNCAFMPVQVADSQEIMTTTSILDGILYALYQGADVINVSLGTNFTGRLSEAEQRDLQNNHFKEEERIWKKVMEIAEKHNSIVVMAAGNDNMLAGVEPMNRPKNFVVVSALDKDSQNIDKAGFSNYGDYSTISAPGVSIYSSVSDDGYQVMDGTSMAAPIITGTIALMKSLNKDLTVEQIKCILQGTGKPVEGNVGNMVQLDKVLEKVKSGDFSNCQSQENQPETPSTGDVQVLLSWDNYNDLDLMCTDPFGNTVSFQKPRVASGGMLEIDTNRGYPDSETPIENIYWPTGGAPGGTYNVYLSYYKKHTPTNDSPYKIKVKYGNKTEEFTGTIKEEDRTVLIGSFTLGNGTGPSQPPASGNERKNELLREMERLRKQLDLLERELGNINN
jgi:subtilisin family serine protease